MVKRRRRTSRPTSTGRPARQSVPAHPLTVPEQLRRLSDPSTSNQLRRLLDVPPQLKAWINSPGLRALHERCAQLALQMYRNPPPLSADLVAGEGADTVIVTAGTKKCPSTSLSIRLSSGRMTGCVSTASRCRHSRSSAARTWRSAPRAAGVEAMTWAPGEPGIIRGLAYRRFLPLTPALSAGLSAARQTGLGDDVAQFKQDKPHNSLTTVRLQLKALGYDPIPLKIDKKPYLGWP